MTTLTLTVDWPSIHAAAHLCDAARYGTTIGRVGAIDVFGGSYIASDYERRGLAGLVAIARAADALADQAWLIVHSGSRDLDEASTVRGGDSGNWWCVLDDGSERLSRSRRGARWMATRRGGEAVFVPDGRDAAKRRAHVVTRIRAAVEVAIHVDALRRLLAATGVIEYRPAQKCCGVDDGRIHLTGIRWLRGETQERDTPPTIQEARAAVAAL